MNQITGLQRIFSSNFYIDGQYAMSFAPSILQVLNGNSRFDSPEKIDANTYRDALISRAQENTPAGNSEKNVVVVSMKQPIVKYDEIWFGLLGSKTYINILKNLAADSSVLGVVLDIDSGGGQVYGTPELHDALINFPKPIVTYTDGYLCSAAYYIGNGTNYIVANKRADAIGSIGALANWLDFTGIFEKLGAKSYLMYATESEEKNAESRAIIEKGDTKPYIKNILDPIVTTFQEDMKAARPQLDEKVFKGNTWGANDALELGLIDEIGTIETAISKVISLAADSETNNSNSNNSDMSKENSFPKLAAVLGVETVEAKKANIFSANETVSLTAEQLETIEAALADPGDSQKLADLQTALDTANAGKKTAEDDVIALESAVNSAIETAGLTAEKKDSATENVALLSSKVVEYAAKPGAEPTTVKSSGDKSEEKEAFVDEIAEKVDLSNI